MTMNNDTRLYGLPDAEELFLDPASVYESDIEPNLVDPPTPDDKWIIEEWSVHPPQYHLPSASWITEQMAEWVCENGEIGEGGTDAWLDAASQPVVILLAEALRNVMAEFIKYRMAKDKLAEHTLTFDSDGNPLLDGEPLYVSLDAAMKKMEDG